MQLRNKRLARHCFLFLAVLCAAGCICFSELASKSDYHNKLFYATRLGGGAPTTGTIDRIVPGMKFPLCAGLDTVFLHYSLGYNDRRFDIQTKVDDSIGSTLKPGNSIRILYWSDGPEVVRVDTPSELLRYRRQADWWRTASAITIVACSFCLYRWFKLLHRKS